ncbi:MAG TPA: NADPH-dependent FMN reductase [Polyangia bacterium]|jgi:FMN reductase|nr:NADPH-dependent FMN reductase [Polyangia bacterium]
MPRIVTITGSPSAGSRTLALTNQVADTLAGQGFDVQRINVRELPAEDLLHAHVDAPAIKDALALVESAQGVVVSTPVYKAAYSGVLKAFLDLLPQFGLTGKVVLPLLTGGTLAHVLTLDYALRPVLMSLGAQHVVAGLFVLDKLVERQPTGGILLDSTIANRLEGVVGDFIATVRRFGTPSNP